MASFTMRDIFWNRLFDIAKDDNDVMLVIADLGAPSLDRFKTELGDRIINVGIAEQNAILIATGLALAGKKPYVYSISAFLTTRCYEQIRLFPAGMNLPITLVGVGAGISYSEAGPTHHSLEDITLLRGLPNMTIYNVSDNVTSKKAADASYMSKGPCYVRLDREIQEDFHSDDMSFQGGLEVLVNIEKICILATGNMARKAVNVSDALREENIRIGVVEAYSFPLDESVFGEIFEKVDTLITLEEHSLVGGLGSCACETVMDTGMNMKIKRFGFDVSKGYSYTYGGRDVIHKEYAMDEKSIADFIKNTVG